MPENFRNILMRLLVALLLTAGASSAFCGDELKLGGGEVELRGFNTNGERLMKPDDPQKCALVRWRVGGARALLNPPLFTIYGFRLHLEATARRRAETAQDAEPVERLKDCEWTLKSPQCLFDQQKCEMRSSSAVLISGMANGNPCSMGGIGCDVLWRGEDHRLVIIIRNAAWMKFSRKLLEEGGTK